MNTVPEPEVLIQAMAKQLKELFVQRNLDDPIIIGIRSGGVWVAERLHGLLKVTEPLSILDINFYRDDFSRINSFPQVKPSAIRTPLDDRHILLVDDVLHTGRTICAALNALSDYGRAATVSLAILLDRGDREMPIGVDVVGTVIALKKGQQVKLRGPEPLRIEIIDKP